MIADTPPACIARVVDGDTIAFCRERIRLLGIDAPDHPKNCRRRRCVPGGVREYEASSASMRRLITGPVTIERVGRDRYGRTLALVSINGRDLSCLMLREGGAYYRVHYDNGGRVRKMCPQAAAARQFAG